ncbi:hypothetical protein E2C01_080795 [Portunus trituberculatus]|uniref:Uncharacterized protein n=1 Tax=Portunus trituberculatus TaxID=210409 RepID=A0A5B7IWB3_PORTR|nr:hypothetical protein [Portunus trituberculatus]
MYIITTTKEKSRGGKARTITVSFVTSHGQIYTLKSRSNTHHSAPFPFRLVVNLHPPRPASRSPHKDTSSHSLPPDVGSYNWCRCQWPDVTAEVCDMHNDHVGFPKNIARLLRLQGSILSRPAPLE